MNFLGVDLGTSSVKIVIMDKQGNIVDSISKEYPVYFPKNGWAEQEPTDWWNATLNGIKELVAKSEVDGESIKGIGFSGQMHGLVMLDEEGNSLRPALLWCDQRTQEECDYLNNEIGREKISKYTGNMALTGFTAPKVLWVKKHERELFDKAAHMLLPKDYISYKLTGEFATDVSDASGTLMFDVENRTWSKEMIEILGIDEKVLPKIYESWEVTGKLTKEVADYTGLSVDTVVVGGAGDQAAGAVGTGTVDTGIVSVALGTSGVVFASSDNYSVDDNNRLHSFCHANGKFHQMGVMLSAAASLKWWVDNVNKDVDFEGYDDLFLKLIDEADKAEIGGKGLLFLPYLMGERTPHSDPDARGTFIGMGMTHERGHMTRAILEGVCYGLRDSLEILRDLNVPIEAVRVSGGGAKSKLWKQILADVFNVKVQTINSKEGPAYGGAILAAVGCGLYNSVDEACEALIKVTETVEPIQENVEKYNEYYNVYKDMYGILKDSFKKISMLDK
ncbi:xylulokinase [Clostridium grantii]|uniref:Xylulose kinase n=1 Tax=Clostridium grantii DSM 8605 TaxID=1121316 RepID=A0A1M5X8B4_9CLOT|nr:xylulokinase [Clostridium grantii]SHH96016.1 xylulokinase [Clostridium grantii DSM 8605]